MRDATGWTKRPRRRNKRPGVESRGGQRGRQSARDQGHQPDEEAATAARNKAERGRDSKPAGGGERGAQSHGARGPRAPGRTQARTLWPHRRRPSSHARVRASAAQSGQRTATRCRTRRVGLRPRGPWTPSAPRSPNPPPAVGCKTSATFPVPSAPIPPDLPCHNRRHLPQTLAKTPTLARFPLTLSLAPLPRPSLFSSPRFHPAPAFFFPSQPPRRARRLAPPAG